MFISSNRISSVVAKQHSTVAKRRSEHRGKRDFCNNCGTPSTPLLLQKSASPRKRNLLGKALRPIQRAAETRATDIDALCKSASPAVGTDCKSLDGISLWRRVFTRASASPPGEKSLPELWGTNLVRRAFMLQWLQQRDTKTGRGSIKG
jgi:hypothetical protein